MMGSDIPANRIQTAKQRLNGPLFFDRQKIMLQLRR
jgi:hypothetical protein